MWLSKVFAAFLLGALLGAFAVLLQAVLFSEAYITDSQTEDMPILRILLPMGMLVGGLSAILVGGLASR